MTFNPPPPPGMPQGPEDHAKRRPLELGALAWFFIALGASTAIGIIVSVVR